MPLIHGHTGTAASRSSDYASLIEPTSDGNMWDMQVGAAQPI